MSDKLHKTRGIVLRTVKYGDTSVIVTIFTELFGVQSYLVNGVRSSSRKGTGKANLFQPAALLDLVVYHNEMKQLNRIREFRWGRLYGQVLTDVQKNAVAQFMVELLAKCLKQPESNPDLFHFLEDCFVHLDECPETVLANMPLFFALHLPFHFGFRIADNHSEERTLLDLQEGGFISGEPLHPHIADESASALCSQLLKVMQPVELGDIRTHHLLRRKLLSHLETYYALHVPEFGRLKTIPVLQELFS